MRNDCSGLPQDWIVPAWPAPQNVRAVVTTRAGGVSAGAFASMNLGLKSGDKVADVLRNREILAAALGGGVRIAWLEQVHGTAVADAARVWAEDAPPCADAAVCATPMVATAVLTADCLPVLFCDTAGRTVAAAHAGWRGLAAGVLEATVARMGVPPETVLAWLGPAIGPQVFEVGEEVRQAFLAVDAGCGAAFTAGRTPGKWLADLYELARRRLARAGVQAVYGGGLCTVTDPQRFYSWRRDGSVTGRMVSLVWRTS